MGNRRCKFDMSHPLTSDFAQCHLDTALFADNSAIFHTFVLTAQTFVIFDWTKYPGTEKSVTFRFKGTIIYSLGLFDFAK